MKPPIITYEGNIDKETPETIFWYNLFHSIGETMMPEEDDLVKLSYGYWTFVLLTQ
jgi:hypothetical protein